jgi:hypothetical protein
MSTLKSIHSALNPRALLASWSFSTLMLLILIVWFPLATFLFAGSIAMSGIGVFVCLYRSVPTSTVRSRRASAQRAHQTSLTD